MHAEGASPELKTPLRWRPFLVAVAAAALVWQLGPESVTVRTGLAVTLLVGLLWLTEAIDITFTALLIPVLAVASGLMPAKTALAEFANPVIFLFLGGFALAAALTRHGIDTLLGQCILGLAGRKPVLAAWGLFAGTALLSMWISNTATAAMMLPVALGVASRFEDPDQRTLRFLLLGTAYAASIGGMGTLVGSPPNAIAAAQAGISFSEWLAIGLPVVLLSMPLMVMMLHLVLTPRFIPRAVDPATTAHATRDGDPSQRRQRLRVLMIFSAVVAGWIFSTPLAALTGITKDFDTLVALTGLLALGLSGSLSWRDIESRTGWGILLLFGGGMTLGALLDASGASTFLAGQIRLWIDGAPPWLALLAMVAFIAFLSELVSNTAAAALLVPLMIPVAGEFGLTAVAMAATVALAASSSFMLPVATPPNAIVFGTGRLTQKTMIRCGIWLNLILIAIITVLA
jgi:sodium-dependent dicarboxylate transporter 2/3/5